MKTNRARLTINRLEERATPAVSILPYSGGRLSIRGDQTSNNLVLTLTNNNTVQVQNNTTNLGTYLVNGDITVTMGNSADTVSFVMAGKTLGGNVNILTGNGGDLIAINNGTISGRLAATTGNGADTVNIGNTAAVNLGGVAHTLTANTSNDFLNIANGSKVNGVLVANGFNNITVGANAADAVQISQFVINNSQEGVTSSTLMNTATKVASSFTYTGGFGSDNVQLFGTINGNATVNSREGANALTLGSGAATGGVIGGTLSYITGASGDSFTIADNAIVAGSVNLNTGNGDNTYVFDTDFTIAGGLTVTAGSGVDSITFGDGTAGSINGDINLNLGNGANTVVVAENFGNNGANFNYQGGNDVDDVTVNNASSASFRIYLYAGLDTFTWGLNAFAGAATIDFGSDFDTDVYNQIAPVVTWPQTLINLP